MGHIKEPAGVDFVINSRPLTKDEEAAISEYIRAYKAKHSQNLSRKSGRQLPTKRAGQTAALKRAATASAPAIRAAKKVVA